MDYKEILGEERYNDINSKVGVEIAVENTMLFEAVALWGKEKGLDDPKAQLNKVIEEVGEIAHEITRNNYDSDELTDAIGDTLVTIIILANILKREPVECLAKAYKEIAHRTGKTENGTFIKEQ